MNHHTLVAPLLALIVASNALAQEQPVDLEARIAEGTPLSAEEAAARAIDASPGLERARALARASEATVEQARAVMLPRLELSLVYQHVDGFDDGQISLGTDPAALQAAQMLASQVTDPAARTLWQATLANQASGSVSIAVPRDRMAANAKVTWPVSDLFLAMMPAVEAAEAGSRAREHQLAATQAELRLQTKTAYFTLARARGALAVAEEAERLATAALEQISAATRAGLLTAADELSGRARVAAAAQAVSTAAAGVEISDAALRVLIDAEPGPVYGVHWDARPDAPLPSLQDATQSALDARPELLALRASLDAQRAAMSVNDASAYPHLVVFAGADLANPNRYQIPPQQTFTPSWEVGAALSWSPNDAWMATHRGAEMRAQADGIEAQLEELERALRIEVTRAHAQLRGARTAVGASVATIDAATAAYEARLAQLHAGNGTAAELFAAEAELNAARLRGIDAKIELALATVRLERAMGR